MDKEIKVVRVGDRITKLKLVLKNLMLHLSAYAPHARLKDEQKDHFYKALLHE